MAQEGHSHHGGSTEGHGHSHDHGHSHGEGEEGERKSLSVTERISLRIKFLNSQAMFMT